MSECKNDTRGMKITIDVDCGPLDTAIEKANRLVGLLREAAALIDSLRSGNQPVAMVEDAFIKTLTESINSMEEPVV